MIWQAKPERWQAVAAQFTSLERGASMRNDVTEPLAPEGTKLRKRRRLRMIPARVLGSRERVLEFHRPPYLPYGRSFRADGAAAQGWSEVWVPCNKARTNPPLRGETSRIGDDLIPDSRPGAKNWTIRCVA
jgi:hypothetical protein